MRYEGVKSEDEPAFITAATLSTHVQKPQYQIKMLVNNILVPRDRPSFGQHQDSGPLGRSNFQNLREHAE